MPHRRVTWAVTTRDRGLRAIADMSLERKVGMLLMAPLIEARLDELLGRYYCGSLIVWGARPGGPSCDSVSAFSSATKRAQEASFRHRALPVWLHGYPKGDVGRWAGWSGYWLHHAAARNMDPVEVEHQARSFGTRWRELGLHNLPDPTLNVPLFDTCIGKALAISSSPDRVTAYGAAFVRGVTAARCGTMAQHFPAHGATPLDSHTDFPVVNLPADAVWRDHLAPYQRCFAEGCTSLCTAHLACPALDPDPAHIATTSRVILHDVLRVKMGFHGLVIADDVGMKGFQKNRTLEDGVVAAVNAGCDSLCITTMQRLDTVFCSLLRAAEEGRLSMERIDEAIQRQVCFMGWLGL